MNQYQTTVISQAEESHRHSFIKKTYLHLLIAVIGFVSIEMALFKSGAALIILELVQSLPWLAILGAFMLISWIATRFAQNSANKKMQYLGLSLYVVAEAIIFVPLLFIAEYKTGGGAIESAATATLLGFGGLTAIAFGTRADFSWMGKVLIMVGIAALIAIVCGSLFGFTLGTWFSVAMVLFAGCAILHDTSNIIHHYSEDDYVAASLQLFASIALMFWYLLTIFNKSSD